MTEQYTQCPRCAKGKDGNRGNLLAEASKAMIQYRNSQGFTDALEAIKKLRIGRTLLVDLESWYVGDCRMIRYVAECETCGFTDRREYSEAVEEQEQ